MGRVGGSGYQRCARSYERICKFIRTAQQIFCVLSPGGEDKGKGELKIISLS